MYLHFYQIFPAHRITSFLYHTSMCNQSVNCFSVCWFLSFFFVCLLLNLCLLYLATVSHPKSPNSSQIQRKKYATRRVICPFPITTSWQLLSFCWRSASVLARRLSSDSFSSFKMKITQKKEVNTVLEMSYSPLQLHTCFDVIPTFNLKAVIVKHS